MEYRIEINALVVVCEDEGNKKILDLTHTVRGLKSDLSLIEKDIEDDLTLLWVRILSRVLENNKAMK